MCKASLALGLVLILAGCGGGSNNPQVSNNPTPTPGALTVCGQSGSGCTNPAVVPFGSTTQFTATAATGTTPALNWSVNGVPGGAGTTGTITQGGLYTAPATFDSGRSVTIAATSQSNSSVTGNANAVIVNNTLSEPAPALLGTSGGNVTDLTSSGKTITCCSGTLGSLIASGGNLFILSNNHVLNKSDQGAPGQAISQPGLIDNNCSPGTTVAHLTKAAPVKPNPCTGSPCTGPAPSNVDAAIAEIVSGTIDSSGSILDLGAANAAGIDPAPPSANLADPATVLGNNEPVAKVGRSSGLTCSTLQSVSANFNVDYASACGGSTAFTATFTGQVVVNGATFSASGDSGSLIVTADTARPVALLFAGSSSNTVGTPIQMILGRAEFNQGSAPTMVGGGDHAVSCGAVSGSAGNAAGRSAASLTPQERARVAVVLQRHASALMMDSAITSVDIGASLDSPGEGALLFHVFGNRSVSIPQVVEGVRTAVVVAAQDSGNLPVLSRDDIAKTTAIKEAHAANLMAQSGIQGVGVGRSDDNPAETAIVIYVIKGLAHPAIPQTIDGVRTKIVESDRFRASGWGNQKQPAASKCRKN